MGVEITVIGKQAKLLGDLGVGYDNDEYRLFNIETYRNLNSANTRYADMWKPTLMPANDFIASLPEEDQIILGRFFYDTKKLLSEEFLAVAQLTYIREMIRDNLYHVFTKLRIAERTIAFAKTDKFLYPDLSFAGKRSTIDSPEKTFVLSEYQLLTSIAVTCKLLSPIFGEFMDQISIKVDKALKETHVIGILATYLEHNYKEIIDKLLFYIAAGAKIPKDKELAFAFAGFSLDRLQVRIYGNIILRKFVNIDVYNRTGNINILSHILSAILNAKELKSIKNPNSSIALGRFPLSGSSFMDGDDGNTSNYEVESFISIAPADTPILVKLIVEDTVRMFIQNYELDYDTYITSVEYYLSNVLPVTPLNKYIVSVLFGNMIGGAVGIDMLTMEQYIKLVVLTQMFAIKHNYSEIVHILSVHPTHVIKSIYSITDNQIMTNKGMCYGYQNCKKMFPYAIDGITWDSKAKDICEFIVKYEHRYNTAPAIWNLLQEEQNNDGLYQYDVNIDKHIFGFIHIVLVMLGQQERVDDEQNIYVEIT